MKSHAFLTRIISFSLLLGVIEGNTGCRKALSPETTIESTEAAASPAATTEATLT